MALEKEALHQKLIDVERDFRDESESTKQIREILNKKNWQVYHGRYKLRKKKGQARKFLHKQALAVEQVASVFKSAIMNFDKWLEVEAIGGFEDEVFDEKLVKSLMRFHMEKAKIKLTVSDAIKLAANESRVTLKVGGEMVPGPRYPTRKTGETKNWELRVWLWPFQDYFEDPEPTREKLYKIARTYVDKFRVLDRSKSNGNNSGIYDAAEIEKLAKDTGVGSKKSDKEYDADESRGNVKGRQVPLRRAKTEISEFWGTVLDSDGSVLKAKINGEEQELRNVLFTIANQKYVIRGPIPNPRWAGVDPFITGRLLRVPFSEWDKALMDSATDLSITSSEIFNLMIDGAKSAIFGIRQIKPHLLLDPRQIEKGIGPQTTLKVTDETQPGEKVLETISSGQPPNEILPFFNQVNSLLAENAFADATLGSLPAKRVLATEINSANQSLSQVFDGLASDFEEELIEPLAEQCWFEILQNVDKFPVDDLARMISDGPEDLENARAKVEALNSLSKRQRFDRAARGFKFRGKGVRTIQAALKEFQRTTTLIQSIAGVPQLFQEFQKEHSFSKLLSKLLTGIGFDAEELKKSDREVAFDQEIAKIREQAVMEQEATGRGVAQPPGNQAASSPNPQQPQDIASGNSGNQQ